VTLFILALLENMFPELPTIPQVAKKLSVAQYGLGAVTTKFYQVKILQENQYV